MSGIAIHWSANETLLRFVRAAVSSDETRPQLCALHVIGGKIYASDGHRLHVASLPDHDEHACACLPSWVLAAIDAYDCPVVVRADWTSEHGIRVTWGQSEPVEVGGWAHRPPPFDAVIPRPNDSNRIVGEIKTRDLRVAVKEHAAPDAYDIKSVIVGVTEGQAHVLPPDADEYPAAHAKVNSRYLLDAVRCEPGRGENVVVSVVNEHEAITLRGSLGRAVIMPVRV